MFKVSVVTTDGTALQAEEATYHLDTDQGLLIIEVEAGRNFFNWDHVVYFGASEVDA